MRVTFNLLALIMSAEVTLPALSTHESQAISATITPQITLRAHSALDQELGPSLPAGGLEVPAGGCFLLQLSLIQCPKFVLFYF